LSDLSAKALKLLRFTVAQATRGHAILLSVPKRTETETKMSLAMQLKDYRLTTARIYYHMPDYPGVLQTYVWQELDLAPGFPELRKFLDFWQISLDGKLHSVRVASANLIKPPSYRSPGAYMRLH
jgi:uncharacterized protein Usg